MRAQELKNLANLRLSKIVEMKNSFSVMIRRFQVGSKEIVHKKIGCILPEIAKLDGVESFQRAHDQFCTWGVQNLSLAAKKRRGKVVKSLFPPSYGQVAKILDTLLKIVIYYKNWPDEQTSERVGKYLNSPLDNKMMMLMKFKYPHYFKQWPSILENVDKSTYLSVQELVRNILKDEGRGLMPVQFDDLYRDILNR